MREDIFFDSAGFGTIHASVWYSDEKPKAILQIVHGIAEHVARYDEFAEFLVGKGYAVVAEDHMGHGLSTSSENVSGYFHGGWGCAIKDSVALMDIARDRFGQIPYFLFGHSMGSFMVRNILADYPELQLTGCIICGTGWQSGALLSVAVPLAKVICRLRGDRKPGKLLNNMAFGAYNKRVIDKRTPHDWLSTDDKAVDAYENDPMCGFIPSSGLMRDMLMGIRYIQKEKTLLKMNKQLPCFFIAGQEDPVGNYGEGVLRAEKEFLNAGMQTVSAKIYPLCRHEILNEMNRFEVYEDVLNWMENLI